MRIIKLTDNPDALDIVNQCISVLENPSLKEGFFLLKELLEMLSLEERQTFVAWEMILDLFKVSVSIAIKEKAETGIPLSQIHWFRSITSIISDKSEEEVNELVKIIEELL